MIRRSFITSVVAMALAIGSAGIRAQAPATQPQGKAVRVLSIGNSFSSNATAFLRPMAEAGGNQWLFGHAMIGGSSFERHMTGVAAFEINPDDPAGKPYRVTVAGKPESVSLRYLLESQPWEYVTIQQASVQSYRKETFEPHASNLVAYVHRYAPQAKLLIHETWAYRADHPSFKPDGLSQAQMYARLHQNYLALAAAHQAVGVIPVGTAFQNVREDSRWTPLITPNVDPKTFVHPKLPKEDRELNIGWTWNNRVTPRALVPDRGHASALGKFLGACVWYEFFYGDVRQNPYRPDAISEEDAALLRDIAHRTVHDKLIPKAAATPIPTTGPVEIAPPLPPETTPPTPPAVSTPAVSPAAPQPADATP